MGTCCKTVSISCFSLSFHLLLFKFEQNFLLKQNLLREKYTKCSMNYYKANRQRDNVENTLMRWWGVLSGERLKPGPEWKKEESLWVAGGRACSGEGPREPGGRVRLGLLAEASMRNPMFL